MSNYAYNILISRIDEEGENKILLDQDITADQVIEAILDQRYSDSVEPKPVENEVKTEPEPTAPVPAEKPTPKKKPAKESKKRKTSYDIQAVKDDVNAGMSVADIAAKHKIPKQAVYNARMKMKTAGDHSPEVEELQAQALNMNEEMANCKDNHEKVIIMLRHGMQPGKVYNLMHDYMTDQEYRQAVTEYEKSSRMLK